MNNIYTFYYLLEDEPPSLKSYPDDKQRNGRQFSRNFESFYRSCLQKNARSRPSAGELLKHKLFTDVNPDSLVTELLSIIPSVGDTLPANNANEMLSVTEEAFDSQYLESTGSVNTKSELNDELEKYVL